MTIAKLQVLHLKFISFKGDFMKHKIDIVYTEVDSGDCELGCWNTGEGVIVKVDGNTVYEVEAWAGCCDNSTVDKEAMLQSLLKHFNIDSEVSISVGDNDYEYYEDYEELDDE